MTGRLKKILTQSSDDQARALLMSLARNPDDFIWLGGNGSRWTIVPLLVHQIPWQKFLDTVLPDHHEADLPVPFSGGLVGIIPYEAFSPYDDGPAPSIYSAKGALLRDNQTGEIFAAASSAAFLSDVAHEAQGLIERASDCVLPADLPHPELTAHESDTHYESMIGQALEDIRSGRYYQINLLRYFACSGLDSAGTAALLSSRGGPYSSWFRIDGQDIVSFSPEQFVEVRYESGHQLIATSPIKGTAPRYKDSIADRRSGQDLLTSKKNLAELHMIIDLMRNDLHRICVPASVEVRESNRLASFVNVHHLIGSITGLLKSDLRTGDFLAALCPGGSITGAPKIEVMQAIRQYENRSRGYFMGHAFLRDISGRFDSSVLIRTLIGSAGNKYEFSAGSGIVIHSDPEAERLEIDAKCNVLRP